MEKDSIIEFGNSIISIERHQKGLISDTLNQVRSDNVTLDNKVRRNRKIWFVLGGVGIIEGFILWLAIKP